MPPVTPRQRCIQKSICRNDFIGFSKKVSYLQAASLLAALTSDSFNENDFHYHIEILAVSRNQVKSKKACLKARLEKEIRLSFDSSGSEKHRLGKVNLTSGKNGGTLFEKRVDAFFEICAAAGFDLAFVFEGKLGG